MPNQSHPGTQPSSQGMANEFYEHYLTPHGDQLLCTAEDDPSLESALQTSPVTESASLADPTAIPLFVSTGTKRKVGEPPGEYGPRPKKMPKSSEALISSKSINKSGRIMRKDPFKSLLGANIFDENERNDEQPGPSFDTFGNRKRAIDQLYAGRGRKNDVTRAEFNVACQAFGGRNAQPAGENQWSIKGMKATLTHHQLFAAAKMRSIENKLELPKGGLLADQMGLGSKSA